MLFYDFYSKLEKAIGENSLKDLPPKKIKKCPYIKIFMLMTLSNLDEKPTDHNKCLKDVLEELKQKPELNLNSEALEQLNGFIAKLEVHPGNLSEDFENTLKCIRLAIEQKFNLLKDHFNSIHNLSVTSSDQFIEYLKYKNFWRYQSEDKFRKCCKNKNDITGIAKEISSYLVDFPYFTKVINGLKDDEKKKLYEEFKYDLTTVPFGNSLDFLGTDLANLLRNIIIQAANKDELYNLEKLWKEEKENFLEMVFYPMLNDFIIYERYYRKFDHLDLDFIVLKILNENEGTIIEKHSNFFLLNLFFFISKKEQIFKYIKLEDVSLNDMRVFSVIPSIKERIYKGKKTSDSNISYLSSYYEIPMKEFFSRYYGMPNDHEPLFKDIKQILEFKKFNKKYKLPLEERYSHHIGEDSYLGIKQNLFNNYYEDVNNKDKIDKAYEKTQDFWEQKKNTKLFKLIQEKLHSEEAQNISTMTGDSLRERKFMDSAFRKLKDYYIRGVIPQREYSCRELIDSVSRLLNS